MHVFRLPGEQVAPQHLWLFAGVAGSGVYVERVYLGSELSWMQSYWATNEHGDPQLALSLASLVDMQKAFLTLPVVDAFPEKVHERKMEYLCGWKEGDRAIRMLAPSFEAAMHLALQIDQHVSVSPSYPEFCFEKRHIDHWTRKLYSTISHPQWEGVDEDLRYLNSDLNGYCEAKKCA